MDDYIIGLTIIGIAALGMAWMPAITQKTKVSYSIIYVLLGVLLFSVVKHIPLPNPFVHQDYALHLSELVVIVSLMGTGLKIDEPFSLKAWAVPFRLVTITMILCIGIVAVVGVYAFNFDWASALLLGAVLAPTDPVLASDVQVGPPLEEDKDNIRFSLSAEAGMNDGMAFPFTWLAIVIAMASAGKNTSIGEWFAYYFLYKIIAGVVIGFGMGRLLAYLLFYLPEKKHFAVVNEGFIAISATLAVYGITELLLGYGFIAVFVTAITLRNYELHHKFHKKMHSFADQIERILLAIVLIVFGGSLVSGILNDLSWNMVVFGLIFLLLIRPISGLIALLGTKLHVKEKLAISFFGIRGIGSFFYLAFAFKQTSFMHGIELWSLVAFIVLISVLVHGVTANTVMKKLEDEFSEKREKGANEEV
jgi:NhaP-type Na+/H+ or K+/H+ antiporter